MPPKPPTRMPTKLLPTPKARSTPLAKPTPRAPANPLPLHRTPQTSSRTTVPRTPPPPQTPWYQNARLRRTASAATWGTNVVVFFCAIVWIRDHYVRFDRVRGSSMAPTFNPDAHQTGREDWVVFRPVFGRRRRQPNTDGEETDAQGSEWGVRRGDVVTFWKPHRPEEVGIKRVVAVEGDTVYPRRGYALDPDVVYANRLQGMPDGLSQKDDESILGGSEELGKVVIPYGHVWVEGDNWRRSWDSNDFGPISKNLIQEKAVWIWRGWSEFLRVVDTRDSKDKAMGSKVVPGHSEIPALFLE